MSITITFKYPEYDEEGENVIANRECVVNYDYDSDSDLMVISIGPKRVAITDFNEYDYDDIASDVGDILPDDINDLGQPIANLECRIFDELLGKSNIDSLNNTTFTVIYEPELQVTLMSDQGEDRSDLL
jgi:hypothetical protein